MSAPQDELKSAVEQMKGGRINQDDRIVFRAENDVATQPHECQIGNTVASNAALEEAHCIINNLRREKQALEETLEAQKSKVFQDKATATGGKSDAGFYFRKRDAKVRQVGNARWSRLSVDQQMQEVDLRPLTQAEKNEVSTYFGSTPHAPSAARLLRERPEDFTRFKVYYYFNQQ